MAKISEQFQLKVLDATGVIFDQDVVAVSAENATGPISFLSGHTNFITTINGSVTEEMLFAYFKDGKKKVSFWSLELSKFIKTL